MKHVGRLVFNSTRATTTTIRIAQPTARFWQRVPRQTSKRSYSHHYHHQALGVRKENAHPSSGKMKNSPGVVLSNGSSIITGSGINTKTVFSDLGFPVTMHELWPGEERPANSNNSSNDDTLSFGGQLGLIDFHTTTRLPRHVHIWRDTFIHERILVLEGVALVEMNGEMYVIPPRSLVTIAPGVPHTWTACPPGVRVGGGADGDDSGSEVRADGKPTTTVSTGTFLMIYEYEEPTSFRPTKQTENLASVKDYVECPTEELDAIRFPVLDADAVRERCWFVRDLTVEKMGGTAAGK